MMTNVDHLPENTFQNRLPPEKQYPRGLVAPKSSKLAYKLDLVATRGPMTSYEFWYNYQQCLTNGS